MTTDPRVLHDPYFKPMSRAAGALGAPGFSSVKPQLRNTGASCGQGSYPTYDASVGCYRRFLLDGARPGLPGMDPNAVYFIIKSPGPQPNHDITSLGVFSPIVWNWWWAKHPNALVSSGREFIENMFVDLPLDTWAGPAKGTPTVGGPRMQFFGANLDFSVPQDFQIVRVLHGLPADRKLAFVKLTDFTTRLVLAPIGAAAVPTARRCR